jgi:hypothetical protein
MCATTKGAAQAVHAATDPVISQTNSQFRTTILTTTLPATLQGACLGLTPPILQSKDNSRQHAQHNNLARTTTLQDNSRQHTPPGWPT